MAHIITGTWEEIKAHEAELAGHRLTVTVEDETSIDDKDIQARLAALEAWFSLPRPQRPPLVDDSRAGIYGEEPDRG